MRVIAVAILAIATTVGCDDVVLNCHELVVGDTVLVARVNRLTGDLQYVRVTYWPSAGPETTPPLAFVRVGGHRANLVGATPASLEAAGLPELPSRPGQRTFGVNCRRGNVEAFLEIQFANDTLQAVGAAQFAPDECDFQLGWREERAFSLPAAGQTISAAVPAPGIVRECRPAF